MLSTYFNVLVLNLSLNESICIYKILLGTNSVLNDNKILQIASQITTPIGLASLLIIVLYLTYRLFFRSNIFSKIGKGNTFKIIDKIVTYLFLLSLILSILGFTGFIIEKLSFIQEQKQSTSDLTAVVGGLKYDPAEHTLNSTLILVNLDEIGSSALNAYLGVNKYNNQTDILNQKYVLSGPFNLRSDMGEQHIFLGQNITDYLIEGGKLRVCYFLINKLSSIDMDNFVPSQYNPGVDLYEVCKPYYVVPF